MCQVVTIRCQVLVFAITLPQLRVLAKELLSQHHREAAGKPLAPVETAELTVWRVRTNQHTRFSGLAWHVFFSTKCLSWSYGRHLTCWSTSSRRAQMLLNHGSHTHRCKTRLAERPTIFVKKGLPQLLSYRNSARCTSKAVSKAVPTTKTPWKSFLYKSDGAFIMQRKKE